jgi:hypothetical protein
MHFKGPIVTCIWGLKAYTPRLIYNYVW